jgi:RNA polymerase subunit RPABC4/transcription elongation factor Spt4
MALLLYKAVGSNKCPNWRKHTAQNWSGWVLVPNLS